MQTADTLIHAIQELSRARDIESVQAIVRVAARRLTGADGATFVLKDGEHCFYADEDAVSPLWKGKRFPLTSCISGWAMIHKTPAVIPDIYVDARIPHDAYRPTFVKSLVMVPIRSADPIGAIGNYWATNRTPSEQEVTALQALADSTSTAMANVELLRTLDRRVRERTEQLEQANRELEAFAYSVSHDLRAPLRAINGFATILMDDHSAQLDADAAHLLGRVKANATRMDQLIDDFLGLSRISGSALQPTTVDLAAMARDTIVALAERHPGRGVQLVVPNAALVQGDAKLLRILLENLLGNAWKFTKGKSDARIVLEIEETSALPVSTNHKSSVFVVRDNGAGFDPERADKLFTPFTRLHSAEEFEGTGIGLATCRRIVARHGGTIWATAQRGEGATIRFTLPGDVPAQSSR
jgi:signal transduction histidine kinase